MQRKNNILNNSPFKKSGIAMIMAIAVIVILSTIMALSLSLTSQTTKRTTDIYLHEQAVLYSKSVAELALLEIAKEGCKDKFNINFDGIYDANVTMRYIYTGTVGSCSEYFNITTPEQNGSVLMDITVSLSDSTIVTEPIRYFRRIIQKL
ncbi:MAG: hypothetical protein U9P72_03230 [Campylobacterota bacterium]|nr:hypothetical protein [Campylobacterota bacterium]